MARKSRNLVEELGLMGDLIYIKATKLNTE
jgi:hypothetical protein